MWGTNGENGRPWRSERREAPALKLQRSVASALAGATCQRPNFREVFVALWQVRNVTSCHPLSRRNINLDKMQVFKGLEILTNKITHAEKHGVRHYLLGEIEPDSNFTGEDFCVKSIVYI
uniref:ATP binding protein n=1 Tax=Solanum tuberosum TaxID=4113 RepID=M1DMS0_SOLTU